MNKVLTENYFIRLFIKYSLPLLVIGIVSRTFPIFDFFYYLVPVILLIYILLALSFKLYNQASLIIILILLLYPLYCLITAIWSLYPDLTFQKSVYQILLYSGTISAVLLCKKFFPDKSIIFLLPANILIVLISLFSLITNIPDNSWTGGNGLGFMGFAGHQNTLASALLFTLPGVIALGIGQRAKRKVHRAEDKSFGSSRLLYTFSLFTSRFLRHSSFFLLLTINFLLIILSYSRASMLALAVGLIAFLILSKSKKIITLLFSIFAVIFVLYFTISPAQNFINSLISKDGGSILGRRIILWQPSLEAAKAGGASGLGYGVSAPNIKTPVLTGSHYQDGRYIREKGNSFLAIMEETGLIGLLLLLLPVLLVIREFKIQNSKFKINSTFLILNSTLAAMLVHAQFEAWLVGAGSVSLPLYLIILFMLILLDKNSKLS